MLLKLRLDRNGFGDKPYFFGVLDASFLGEKGVEGVGDFDGVLGRVLFLLNKKEGSSFLNSSCG